MCESQVLQEAVFKLINQGPPVRSAGNRNDPPGRKMQIRIIEQLLKLMQAVDIAAILSRTLPPESLQFPQSKLLRFFRVVHTRPKHALTIRSLSIYHAEAHQRCFLER